jgi:hypothetical protein
VVLINKTHLGSAKIGPHEGFNALLMSSSLPCSEVSRAYGAYMVYIPSFVVSSSVVMKQNIGSFGGDVTGHRGPPSQLL